MEKEPRIVEANILSNNKINRSVVVVTIAPVLIFSAVCVIAIWPFIPTIGLLLTWLAVIVAVVLAVVLSAKGIHAVNLMRLEYIAKERESRLHTWEPGAGAIWVNSSGEVQHHLSAQHEQAKLPSPRIVEVTEEQKGGELSPEDAEVIERSKVLNMREDGATLEEIRDALGIPYNRVQRYCKAAVNLEIKKKQR